MLFLMVLSYVEHIVTQTVNYPHGISVADINGDSIPDVVISSTYGNQVFWFQHDGAWNFTSHSVGSANSPLYVKTGDVDGDGSQDIVAGDYMGNTLYIFYNTSGNGSSFTQTTLSAPGSIWEIDLGDIDNDGDLDIAATTEAGVVWFRNDGLGFTLQNIGSVGYYAHGCVLFDADNDGDLDIAYTDPFNIYRNDGTGNFSLLLQDNSLSGSWGLDGYDIDSDGDADVVVNDYDGGAVYIYWNEGSGTFTKDLIGLTGEPEGLDAGDINAADMGDVLVGAASSWVECFYYTSAGFVVDVVANLTDADLVEIADLNNDGCNDLVASGPSANTVVVYENTDCAFGTGEALVDDLKAPKVIYGPGGPWLDNPGTEIRIYDPTGRLIEKFPPSQRRISLEFLPAGTYVARGLSAKAVVFTVR